MRLKQRPEDFQVTESWKFDEDPRGAWFVYLMDKQKLSTFEAVDRICTRFKIPRASVSYCGLKDKQGRTTQLVALERREIELQDTDLRLKPLGRSRTRLSAANTTSNRFAVTVRDLGEDDVARLPASVAEVRRLGVVNYFDSQRFGSLKHGQGFIVKDLMRGDFEIALRNVLARPSELDQSGDAKVKAFWKEHWGEWDRRNPNPGAERYQAVVKWLRDHPEDYRGALLRTEPRWRGLQVFAYQSWLWNEGVKQYLREVVGIQRLVSLRYQAGSLLFPRELDAALVRLLSSKTFPLLAPSTRFDDPAVERAALSVLGREDMGLADLAVPGTPEIHFDPEERPLFSFPGRLAVGEARPDELNRDRFRVNVAFTLPPGAYATLVVKRLFHWTLEPRRAREGVRSRAPAPSTRGAPEAEQPVEAPRAPAAPKGFLARKRAEKAARAERRAAGKATAKPRR
ncbi:tRNA pseudouridine synthase D TruD [Anaeromyxobacter dehalogenans 2CP-1]|uniref:tRNA pseudouridine synthase D TruD n=1 Tax=Anaeromyxobacter dehalogenans (strain ATCC BAA-258 / DSM 21875 / 2CP-1) TaxID=455488 RepID=B8JHA5_ANAD2|nr:tRNA pseudouridine(13) synthase TruD [Anaeromyxobacter dehalogenans]ACL64807.1 tRNA pseudouridine synthase D TruD [Anaeromyxobacter dehalogenans 2CP-1]